MPDLAPSREQIMDALNRILGWAEIVRSPQLARFLSYIVGRTLDGQHDAIKAYSIAVDVFGRPADFDPQSDPIVRVQARRLRGLLEQYYRADGSQDEVRISLPTGRYIPEFKLSAVEVEAPEPIEPPPPEPEPLVVRETWLRKGDITLPWFALLVLAIGIAALAYALSTWEPRRQERSLAVEDVPRPLVVVAEFQNLTDDTDRIPIVAGLAIELVTDLQQFEDIDVRYGGNGAEAEPVASLAPADFVLTGIVRISEGKVLYSAILTETATGNVVWSHAISIDTADASDPAALDDVSKALSLVLGSPRGPLHAPARMWLAGQTSLEGHQNLYLCLTLFHIYRDSGLAADAEKADDCLAAMPETERQSPQGLAAIGSLMAEFVGPDDTVLSDADRYAAAQANLTRAVELGPVSGFVWEQQARLYEAQGQVEQARAAYGSAIQLNPADADALAGFARLLASRGNLDEALPMARMALDAPDPPSWYYGVPALAALQAGDFAVAIDDASRYALADRELGPIIAVMAAQKAGDSGVVNRYLPQILDVASFRAVGIIPQLRKRVGDEVLLRDMRVVLTAAGVPLEALNRPF